MNWRSSNAKCIIFLAMLACAVLPIHTADAQGKGNGVEVRDISVTPSAVEPGKIITASFLVSSKLDHEEEFIESLDLPDGWQSVGPIATLTLATQEKQVRIVGILAPMSAQGGNYTISYGVRSQKDYAIQDSQRLSVEVLRVSKLSLLQEEKPEVVIAGDQYQVKARLINQSNSEIKIGVSAKSVQEFPVTLDPKEVTLAAGGTQIITVKVQTDSRIRRQTRDTLEISVQALDSKEKVGTDLVVCVDVLPKRQAEYDLYHRLSTTMRQTTADNGDVTRFQTEFSGSGSLDELGTKNVDFLFRGPDIQEINPFGQRDEYRLKYSSEKLDLLLGDQTYLLSQLTDYYHYGRGVGFTLRQQDASDLGAYFADSRWSEPDERESGFYYRRQFGSNIGVKLNYLDKQQSSPLNYDDNVWSLETTLKPDKHTNAALEMASSHSSRGGGVDGQAYRATINGRLKSISYSIEKTRAEPSFFGYYNDSDYTSGNVSFPLNGRLHGHVSYHKWENNLDRNPLEPSAPTETFGQVGLYYSLRSGANLSIDYDSFRGQDLLDPASYDFDERSIRLGYGQEFGKSGIQAYLLSGKNRDQLTGLERDVMRYTLYYHIRPAANGYLSLYAQMGNKCPGGSRLLSGSNTVGVSGTWKVKDNLSLNLQYVMNGLDEELHRRINLLYLTAGYETDTGRTWTLRLRRSDQSTRDPETAVLLSYAIPWDIPVSRRQSIGIIKGRVYDADKPGNPGIARAIVSVGGATAATNEKGEFTLASLPPGNYQLTVDGGSLGLDRVTSDRLPRAVKVEGGQESLVEIGVTESARLYGAVTAYTFSDNGSGARSSGVFTQASDHGGQVTTMEPMNAVGNTNFVETGGLGNLLLELTNGAETLRRVTDNRGGYSFSDLRPGKWKLKVYDSNLPELHYVENAESEFEFRPGDNVPLTIRVLPRVRPVQIIEQGTLVTKETPQLQ